MAEAKPGWYPDPSGDKTKLRFWDGSQWTEQFMDAPGAQQAAAANACAPNTAASNASTSPAPQPVAYNTTTVFQPASQMSSTDSTLRLIAFIFNLISTICLSFFIITLAWMIPMTVYSWKIYKGTRPNTVAFGVCNLIFLDMVGGILLLCSTKDA